MNGSEHNEQVSKSLYLTVGLTVILMILSLLFMVRNTEAQTYTGLQQATSIGEVKIFDDSTSCSTMDGVTSCTGVSWQIGDGYTGNMPPTMYVRGWLEVSTTTPYLALERRQSNGTLVNLYSYPCSVYETHDTYDKTYSCANTSTIAFVSGDHWAINVVPRPYTGSGGNAYNDAKIQLSTDAFAAGVDDWGWHTTYNNNNTWLSATTTPYLTFSAPIPPSPSISMYLPENSLTYKEFESWKVSAENLDVGGGYRFGVQYGLSSSTFPTYTDWSGGLTVSNATMTVGIAKSQDLIPFSVSTSTSLTWWARPILDTGSQYLTGDMIYFLMRIDPGPRPLPTTYPTVTSSTTGFVNQKLKASWDCEPAEDWTDIGGGMRYAFCKTGEFFFVPQDTEYNNFILQKELERAQTIFPFSIVFAVTDAVETSATSTVGDYDLVLSTPWMGGRGINILTSSTMENAIGTDAKNFVFEALENTIWFVTALGVLFLFI